MHRFFLDEQAISRETGESFALRLSEADAQHARALRIKPGEHIAVVDASGDYFECEVASFDGQMRVKVASHGRAPAAGPRISLFQALAKGDKMDTVVRHATEVGADGFVPFSSSRCVVRLDAAKAAKRRERWAAVAKSAAMQAGRAHVPEVEAPAPLAEACERLGSFDAVVVFWEEADEACSIPAALEGAVQAGPEASVAVVVGPEGGLAESEVDAVLASNPNARLASMGRSILRAETAGVVGVALVSYELGGMGNAPKRAAARGRR